MKRLGLTVLLFLVVLNLTACSVVVSDINILSKDDRPILEAVKKYKEIK